jgi:CheY-like chemotaxis protein
MTMQEDERRRIARELHDSLGQQLGVAQAELAQLRDSGGPAGRIPDALERRLAALSDEVRDLSHRLHPSILDDLGLPAALRALAEEFERARRIPVRVEVDEGLAPLSPTLATAAYRIAQEALHNAAKHSRDGVIISLAGGDALRMTVEDRGPGFDVETVRAKGGLGILSMRERARAAGGALQIESAPGQGTMVRLVVPWPKAESRPGKPRVVIADDHEASRYILRRFAASECEVIAEVENGLEAIQEIERLRPEVAILDVSMPVMGGVEAARLIRARQPEVRLIFASQHTSREYVEEAFRAGGQGYIVKQAAAAEVVEAIREVLSGRQFRSPLAEGRTPSQA